MRTPLQEQLLKAGLVKKDKVAAAVRQQKQQREGKANDDTRIDVQRLHAERVERDRALAAEQKAQAHARELRAQVRQIVETHKLARKGEIVYRFAHEGAIRQIYVDTAQRAQLAKGQLVIVQHDTGYELLPRAAADLVAERQGPIVLDQAAADAVQTPQHSDPYYDRFVVPDDLIW